MIIGCGASHGMPTSTQPSVAVGPQKSRHTTRYQYARVSHPELERKAQVEEYSHPRLKRAKANINQSRFLESPLLRHVGNRVAIGPLVDSSEAFGARCL
jgi:hypothetical protein